MFTFLYDKFTQENIYQILSQSARFCRLYIKKHFGVFLVHSVVVYVKQICKVLLNQYSVSGILRYCCVSFVFSDNTRC